ncbi:MAG TPA: hypothetical protein VG435_15735, partial [Acidimicrobiales bacterium]|nr:hypothetical protein [Acidimicrobiales bacterium]
MGAGFTRLAAGAGISVLSLGVGMSQAPVAVAAPTNAVSWTNANFHGYATGSEVHLGVLPTSALTLADVEQAFSGATTSSAGLTNPQLSEYKAVVQSAQAGTVKAYGLGSGLEVGLGTQLSTTDQNQIKLAGQATQLAPPNGGTASKQVGPISVPGVVNASLLAGHATALYDPQVCPLGQPISFGTGDAAAAGVLGSGTTSTVSTAGSGTSTAQSSSETYLSSNGDGTFGLSTRASDIIAPVSVNLPGGALSLQIAVQSAGGINDPVSLTAKTTGESTGASLTFSTDDVLQISLVTQSSTTVILRTPLTSIGKGGLHIPLATNALASDLTQLDGAASGVAATLPAPVGSTLSGVLANSSVSSLLSTVGATASQITSQVAVLSLGSIDVDTYPHVIGQAATDAATPVGGTAASGSLDLLHLNLALSGTIAGTPITAVPIADLAVGHLETSANLTAPITCSLPVIKTAKPTAVTAGQTFTYNIDVPDPAKLDLIDCNLDNVSVTDTITDFQGLPTFTVTSATDTATGARGAIDQVSPNKAIVTWTGLKYTVATAGQPPNPPIPLAIGLSVAATSPSGVITDTAVAQATTSSCQGGAVGSTDASAAAGNGAALTGSYTLNAPSVTAAAPAATTPATAAKTLPFTGAMGGFWQPIGGLAALGIGAGGLILVRRARRLN